MWSIATTLHARNISRSASQKVFASSWFSSLQARLSSGSESESVLKEPGFSTDDEGKAINANLLFLEHLRRVPRNRSPVPVLQSWIKAGNKFGPVETKAIFEKLEWKKKYFQALKVVEWLLKEKPFDIVEYHYARWLTYINQVHGYKEVENAFKEIPPEFQKEVVYCRLFDAFLKNHKVIKAKDLIKKMAEEDISVPSYMFNNLITYCIKNSMQHKIHALLEAMMNHNIPYNLQTYNNLLSLASKNSNLEWMEKIWASLKTDVSVKPDFVSYATIASAYFFAGEHEKALSATMKAERLITGRFISVLMVKKMIIMNGLLKRGDNVSRLYEKLKAIPGKTSVFSYTSVMEAYGEVGLVDKAEEVMKEMEAYGGMLHLVQYNTIIGVYCTNGLIKKAEEMLPKLVINHKPDIITYSYLLLGYLKCDKSKKASRMLNQVISQFDDGTYSHTALESRSWLLVTNKVIRLLAERSGEDDATLLLDSLQKTGLKNNSSSYKFILRTYEQSFGHSWQDKGKNHAPS